MDNLLCDEVWLKSPPTNIGHNHNHASSSSSSSYNSNSTERYGNGCCFYTTKEDCQRAFQICLEKENGYMPQYGYHHHLQSSSRLVFARFRAMEWFVKSQSRLNLSCQTVFNAANYFDRFFSMNQCEGWKHWMVELLAIACLCVASKFGETVHPPLHEIQMEDLDHSFQSGMIQRMELTLLKALGWRLGSISPYSYMELLMLMCKIDSLNSYLLGELTTSVTDLLLGTLSDYKFLEFRPCVIAISALRCGIKESLPSTYNSHFAYITGLIPEDQKDDLIKCHNIMEGKLANPNHDLIDRRRYYYCCPSSPVTVLKVEQVDICDFPTSDLSHFERPGFNLRSSSMKRKRKRKRERRLIESGIP